MNSGIPYFPLDVHLDDKFDLIEAEFGLKGFAIVVKLLQKIYGGNGYYCKWTKDVALLFAKNINANDSFVSEIVSASVRRGIFNEKLFEKYSILTSKGIQQRYFEAVSRRKKVDAEKQYLLVDVTPIYKNVNILSENVNISSENVNISEQRREEKSKEEYSKVEERSAPAAAVLKKYEQLIGMVTPAVMEGVDFFMGQGVEASLIIRLIEYACEQGKRTWSYIQASIRGNMDAGIKTLEAYNRAQAERAETAKRVKEAEKKQKSKFNNYTDTNKPDYSDFGQQIIADMLAESEG
jgi:DnaD/phage-associated family protein